MSFVDDILDFLAFLLLLGICTAVAFGVVLPIVSESSATATVIADKSAPEEKGYKNDSGFDGKLSKMELVLTTEVQDDSLPYPKKYSVNGGAQVDVTPSYRADLPHWGDAAYKAIKNDPSTTRYIVTYKPGSDVDGSGAYYDITNKEVLQSVRLSE